MTIIDVQIEFFQAHRQEMHYIANIQIENPIILIFDSKNGLDIVLQLDITFLSLLQSHSFFLVDIIIGGLLITHLS